MRVQILQKMLTHFVYLTMTMLWRYDSQAIKWDDRLFLEFQDGKLLYIHIHILYIHILGTEIYAS